MVDAMDYWSGEGRRDGARVMPSSDMAGKFVAIRSDGLVIARCPCCLQLLDSIEAAKRIANYCWPVWTPQTAAMPRT